MKYPGLFFFAVCMVFGNAAWAEKPVSDLVTVEEPFARATAPGMPMSGAFMTILNHGATEHFVVNANSDIARNVELHTHTREGGMMRMRRVAHLHLKPNQKKILKPGGLHIMLMGLHKALTEGDSINIELEFEDGSNKSVTVPVKSISAAH
jgi:copper(I)-binding protein